MRACVRSAKMKMALNKAVVLLAAVLLAVLGRAGERGVGCVALSVRAPT